MVALLLLVVMAAHASVDCDPAALEEVAYTGRLTEDDRACLEQSLSTGTPKTRANYSFYLIIDASVAQRNDEAGELMQRHLSTFHTRDAEVAYLYANHLKKHGFQNAEEIVRWAKVALDGRYRWTDKRQNYTTMVKTLYDMLNEAAMVSAIQAEQAHRATPTDNGLEILEFRRRRARYWLIVSAPCLHNNECEPRFEVEIEGAATCDDMLVMEDKANKGQLTGDHRTCLRARYRRIHQVRIVDILTTDANKDRTGKRWNRLLAWHFDLSGMDDATVTAAAATFLSQIGKPEEAIQYADLALSSLDTLRAPKGKVFELHALRLELARKLFESASAIAQTDPSESSFVDAQTAKGRVRGYEMAIQTYCGTTKSCPKDWDKK